MYGRAHADNQAGNSAAPMPLLAPRAGQSCNQRVTPSLSSPSARRDVAHRRCVGDIAGGDRIIENLALAWHVDKICRESGKRAREGETSR